MMAHKDRYSDDSVGLLAFMDEKRLHMSARCMYEHTAVRDPEGHLSVGFLWAALTLLTQLSVGIRGGAEIEFGAIFQRFVQTDLQLFHMMGANTGTYRQKVETILRGTDRTVSTLMRAFGVELTLTSVLRGEFRGRISLETLKSVVKDTLDPDNGHNRLYAAIPFVGEGAKRHHFLVMWYVGSAAPRPRVVD